MTQTAYDPQEHYDRVAVAWDLLLGAELHYGVFATGDEPLDVATAQLTQTMIDAAQLRAGLRVLDVGCGSGAPARHLVSTYGVEVVGITTSLVGVFTAQARAARQRLRGATFEQRDGTDNGYPDASFDRVWVLESSHLMRRRRRLISESARVLRPGGRIVLCDLIRHREIPFHEVRDRRDDFVTLRTAFGDAQFKTLEYYTHALADEGLVVDVVSDLSAATLPTFDRWRANAAAHRDLVIAGLGELEYEAFVRSCDILEGLWRDGTFGYGLVAAHKPS